MKEKIRKESKDFNQEKRELDFSCKKDSLKQTTFKSHTKMSSKKDYFVKKVGL